MKKIILALFVLLATTAACFAQSDLQVLAVVKHNKSESITVKQLKSRCEIYEKQIGKKLTPDERKQVLDSLIDEKLILQAAAKKGVTVADSNVNQYFLATMSQQVGAQVTEKELNDMVLQSQGITLDQLLSQQTGMNVAEYKNYLKNSLIINQYVVTEKREELQKVSATDQQIRQFYENNKTSFVWNDMIKMFVIAVPKGANAEDAKLKANELRGKLESKKLSGDQIAVQANSPDSGYQAGFLLIQKTEPYAAQLGMNYEHLLWLFDQKEDFITDVEDAGQEYTVIKIVGKYGAKMLSISDIVQPDTNVTVYDYIRGNLTQQLQMQALPLVASELSKELNTSDNVDLKKTGDALIKLLDWGN